MTVKSGIWVDSKKAVVVNLKEEDKTFKVIDSGIDTRERIPGEGKKFGRFGNFFFSFENQKKRRMEEKEKMFFKSIIKEVKNSDDLVLFGPSSMKLKLEKQIISDKSNHINIKGVEDADSMTDNQISAWVTKYFNQ